MTGLINLITDHSSKLNILLIVVLMNSVIAVLIHLLSKRKFIKYIPSLLLGFGALFVLITAFKDFTTERGLDLAWIASFIGTAALVGICVCIILDLIRSIRKNVKSMDNSTPKAKKKPKQKKMKVNAPKKAGEIREVGKNKNKTSEKVRKAKKPTRVPTKKDDKSKYNTSKIVLDTDTKKVKASKVDSYDKLGKITFESDDEK